MKAAFRQRGRVFGFRTHTLLFPLFGGLCLCIMLWGMVTYSRRSHVDEEDATTHFATGLRAQQGDVADDKIATDRQFYGGGSDPEHVGGFVFNDSWSYEPYIWNWMITDLGVKSVVDVGCGLGISSQWFVQHGVDTLCVEGSHTAVQEHLVPNNVVEHDYSRGPYVPTKTYDAAWCVEFTEHIYEKDISNFLATFKKAKLIFVTHAQPKIGGWHHVNLQTDEWWINRIQQDGFVYDADLTQMARDYAPLKGPFCIKAEGAHKKGQGREMDCSVCESYAPSGACARGNSYFRWSGLVFHNHLWNS